MSGEEKQVDKAKMEDTYNRDADAFREKSEQLSTWIYIGGPQIDKFAQSIPNKALAMVGDQGSASGRIVWRLIQNGIPAKNIIGIEMSPDQVAIAQKEIPEATFIVGDLATVDLPPNSLDAATQHMVAEHLDNETLKAVNEHTFRTLKPGGKYLVLFTHPSKTAKTSGLSESGTFITSFPWGGEGENFHRTKEDLVKAYEDAGFVIDSVEDLKMPEEAKGTHPDDVAKYEQYDFIRIAITMHKPEA